MSLALFVVVRDDGLRQMLRETLCAHGHRVVAEAHSVEDAVRCIAEFETDPQMQAMPIDVALISDDLNGGMEEGAEIEIELATRSERFPVVIAWHMPDTEVPGWAQLGAHRHSTYRESTEALLQVLAKAVIPA